jgi:hypothetical protein
MNDSVCSLSYGTPANPQVPGLQQIGDGILDTILAAVEFAARLKLEEDYLKFVDRTLKQPKP